MASLFFLLFWGDVNGLKIHVSRVINRISG